MEIGYQEPRTKQKKDGGTHKYKPGTSSKVSSVGVVHVGYRKSKEPCRRCIRNNANGLSFGSQTV